MTTEVATARTISVPPMAGRYAAIGMAIAAAVAGSFFAINAKVPFAGPADVLTLLKGVIGIAVDAKSLSTILVWLAPVLALVGAALAPTRPRPAALTLIGAAAAWYIAGTLGVGADIFLRGALVLALLGALLTLFAPPLVQRDFALIFVLPFVAVYLVWFIFPTIAMVQTSLTDAKLTGGTGSNFVGFANYIKLFKDRLFGAAVWNTSYFVLLTVIPNTLIGLAIALMVTRLKGWAQSIILAMFFLPYILPVSVVYLIWQFVLDQQFGIGQYVIESVVGRRVPLFREIPWFLPTVAWITIWWTNGFNVLLYLAGLRAISPELYEAASLDGATRWQKFSRITWPLIWPVTALVLTIQLILQLKIFDQVYLYSIGGRADATMTMVQYVYKAAFVNNKAGFAATGATVLFAVVVVFSVLQFQLLRGGNKK